MKTERLTPAHSEATYGETPERTAVATFSMNGCEGSRRVVETGGVVSIEGSLGVSISVTGSLTLALDVIASDRQTS